MTNLLAIDPGNVQSAYVVLQGNWPKAFSIVPNQNMLELIEWFSVPIVCEKIACMGMAVGAEILDTCEWIGRFEQKAAQLNLPFHKLKRHQIKMHMCSSTQAKDGNIRQALIDKLGPQGTKKNPGPTYGIHDDIWSALAVGITFLETQAA
jgi:hypothetical protein